MSVFRPTRPKRQGNIIITGTIPYRWLRVYDNSAAKPATPFIAPASKLLLEIDLTGSTWSGLPLSLTSTVDGITQAMGFPLFVRLVSSDGTQAIDVNYKLPPDSVTPAQEIQESNLPDSGFVRYPAPWLTGTPVRFTVGDLVYIP